MFKKSSLGSAKSFPGGRRDAGAFQELRQLTAEEKNEPHVVEKPAVDAAQESTVGASMEESFPCTCPPEPEHDHDIASAEGEGMPPLKNNCKACFPPAPLKVAVIG